MSIHFRCVMLYFLCGLSIQADSYYKIPLYTPILNPTNSWSKYRTQYGLINEAGTQVIPPRYDMLGEVSEGFVAYRIGNAPCGYLDVSGRIVIPPIYARCFPFRNGIARVYRFIGDTHPYSCRHEANRSIESILITKKNQPLTDGRKFLLASDTFSEGLMPVMLEGKKCVCFEGHNCDSAKYGYINIKASLSIAAKFDWAGDFKQGKAIVRSDNIYAIVDRTGTISRIPEQFEIIPFFEPLGDYFVARSQRKYCFVNVSGTVIANRCFTHIHGIYDGQYAVVCISDDIKLCWRSAAYAKILASDGKLTDFPETCSPQAFKEKLIPCAKEKNKIGFVSINGEYSIKPQFDSVTQGFIYDLAWVEICLPKLRKAQVGYINKAGEFVWSRIVPDSRTESCYQ